MTLAVAIKATDAIIVARRGRSLRRARSYASPARETTYASLSTIARAITGTAWSGPRFFGLRAGVNRLKDMDSGDLVSFLPKT
jgi:hypothetical protein